jgi:succinate dehydrogenase / fumarate reductase membrane anchor subunit
MNGSIKHWKMTRYAALPLIPAFFYFLGQVNFITTTDRAEFMAWAKSPLPSTALLVFIACAFYHGCLGMEEIIEDYITTAKTKTLARLINKAFFIILGVLSLAALFLIRFKSV